MSAAAGTVRRRAAARVKDFLTVEEAVRRIRAGRMIIVVDDEDRENEGDLTIAAEKVTPDVINFMARHGRGLVCLPMTGERLVPGALVNLERPMKADGRFDGHVVQGHVDGVGRVRELKRLGESAEITIEAPRDLERYLVEKGSVCVDGISLTAYGIRDGAFTVALIPYTLEVTNLRDARAGSQVNLEADVIAKYVERLLTARGL